MEDSSCSCANERLTSEGREFIIAAEVEGVAKLRSCRVFVFYLGNSVALTLFALTVIYSIVSLRGKVNLFFTKTFFIFWHFFG